MNASAPHPAFQPPVETAPAAPQLPYTVQRDEPHLFARVADRVAASALRVRPGLGNLDLGSVLDAARARTGLVDWGDGGFQVPLTRLLEEAASGGLSPLGRCITQQVAVSAVSNRLSLYDYVRRHPEVRSIPIERPIFVVGFPRSGTTLLQNLLALDPDSRALRFWELLAPTPTHADPTRDRWIRRTRARVLVGAAYLMSPEQRVIHEVGVDTAEECWPLFQTRASALNNDLMSGFTGYGDWLLEQDMVPAYREYRLQLQVLAHGQRDSRFVLKCPEHLWFLDALLEVFPDARIVWTHRDPVECIASYCSMASLQIRNMRGRVDRPRLGAHLSSRFLSGVERAMAVRDRIGGDRFYDVPFERFAADPAGTVREIEAWSGAPPSAVREARVEAYLHDQRGDGQGKHIYGAERFSLDVADLMRRFRPYIDRYEIPCHSAA